MKLIALLALALAPAALAERFDAAPFARPCCLQDEHRLQTTFDYSQPAPLARRRSGGWVYGLQWAEERDVAEVRVRFHRFASARAVTLQYWNSAWPPRPATDHTIEDPVDDPWLGAWITPKITPACDGAVCTFRFPPLGTEVRTASYLPAATYRRTLKLRLLFTGPDAPPIDSVQVFTESILRRYDLRLQFAAAGPAPRLVAYNGRVLVAKPAPNGALLTVEAADPLPAGSNDITTVKVRRGAATFSFAPADAEKGPMYLPDFGALVTLATDSTPISKSLTRTGARIRERLAVEPEQTYQRATREIPPLDPVVRSGGRLLLPLSAEASWQKFGYEWGGNILISKRGTKAKGAEFRRLAWPDDTIAWRIGTGATPTFRDAASDSTLAQLEDYLPIGIARWQSDGLDYEQEAFATLLSGPLGPDDPARSEQTPAILLLKMRVRNASPGTRPAHLWFAMRPAEPLAFDGALLTSADKRFTRARLLLPAGSRSSLARYREGAADVPALHVETAIAAGAETVLYFAVPFVPELTAAEKQQLAALDYAAQRTRVVDYWRGATADAVPFHVPEERFNTFAQGLVARIRMAATKDPKSGLYMIPAASYRYQVYANEAAFQCQLLDALGHPALAAQYLQSHIALQGSKPLVGSFTGNQKAVYHGARVDDEYDYTATPYNLNHGAVLWSLAEHYFVTRDRAWLARSAPSMKRAADWIVEQRSLTKATTRSGERAPEYGLLPAGHLEDNRDWGHWFSVNAYASAGMTALGDALRETGDPDAARYQAAARAYREDLRSAVLRAASDAPVTRLRDNTYVPYVPTRAHQRIRLFGPVRVAYYKRYPSTVNPTFRLAATRELLYGPLILLDTSVFTADEPIARWVLDDWEDNATMSEPLGINPHGWVDEKDWFSRGGMVFQANLQNPVRLYLRRDEIRAAIRGLYNNFVSCYYPSVNVFTEEYRQWAHPSGPFFKVADEARFVHRLRDLLVAEFDGDLRLAAGTPARWLETGREIRVTAAPTIYGPVSYTLTAAAGETRATVTLPTRTPYRNAWLHVRLPGDPKIAVTLDGKPWKDISANRIKLPCTGQPIRIVVRTDNGRN